MRKEEVRKGASTAVGPSLGGATPIAADFFGEGGGTTGVDEGGGAIGWDAVAIPGGTMAMSDLRWGESGVFKQPSSSR